MIKILNEFTEYNLNLDSKSQALRYKIQATKIQTLFQHNNCISTKIRT
jgi:hypothetical protein